MSELNALHQPDQFERELAALGDRIAFPTTPDLVQAVLPRLTHVSQTSNVSRFTDRRRIIIWAAAAVLLLAIVASLSLAGLRHAIADAFGIHGIRIVFDDSDSKTKTPLSGSLNLELGSAVSLDAAAKQSSFALTIPDSETYGSPDEVFTRTFDDGGTIFSFVYEPDKYLPEAAETGVGLLLMEFSSPTDDVYFEKRIRNGGQVTETTVNGVSAFWLQGTTELVMVDELTTLCCGPIGRPTANVLIWSDNGVTYRLESALSLADARLIAEHLTSMDSSSNVATPEP
jgi:hypothetical protein